MSAVALGVAAPASADHPPPVSAVAQYVETIPTSDGGAAVGLDKPGRSALPRHAEIELAALKDAATAAALKEVASSSAYGAPIQPRLRDPETGPTSTVEEHRRRSGLDSIGSAAGAVGAGSSGRLALLLAVVAVTTVAAVASARRSRGPLP